MVSSPTVNARPPPGCHASAPVSRSPRPISWFERAEQGEHLLLARAQLVDQFPRLGAAVIRLPRGQVGTAARDRVAAVTAAT
ncbi:MAG: hypothetical protein ABIQ18_01790, partial [Umezawaea sp.]